MAYIGPPAPMSFEEFVKAGCRDPLFEEWKRDTAQDNTVAACVLLGSVAVILALAVAVGAARLMG